MNNSPAIRLLALLLVLSLGASAAASTELIETIPDDAFLSILIERPQRALPPTLVEPALKAMFDSDEAARTIGEAIKRIPGPILLGWTTPHNEEEQPSFFVICRMDGPQIDVDALFEKTVLPAMASVAGERSAGNYKLERGKLASRIIDASNGRAILGYAVKDKLIFAAADPMTARRWAQGEWPTTPWVKGRGIKHMLKRLPREFNARAFFNHQPLVRLAGKPKPNSTEEWMLKFHRPDDLIGTAIDLNWDRNALRIRASLMIAEEAEGIADLLAQPANSAAAMGVFPEDFVAVGRLGWTNADRIATWLYKMTDLFDETISAEYRTELAEFESETGVDWSGGILGNMISELAFGVRVDFTKPNPIAWAVVCPLANASGFSTNLDKLIEHYQLPLSTQEKDGLTVRTSKDTTRFSFCVRGDRFMVADSPNTIVEIVGAPAKKDVALPRNNNLHRCYEEIGDANRFAVMLDIGLLGEKAPMIPMMAGPRFGPLVSDGVVGLAVKSEERLVTIDLHWALRNPRDKHDVTDSFAPGGDEALIAVAESFGASLVQARRQARRAVSMSNMRGIGQGLYMYAGNNKGAFPGSLEDLLRHKDELIAMEMLISPYTGEGPKSLAEVADRSYVLYRPGLTTSSPPTEILMAERHGDGNGACFLFVDGHVEYIAEPEASELIAKIEAGAESVRPSHAAP